MAEPPEQSTPLDASTASDPAAHEAAQMQSAAAQKPPNRAPDRSAWAGIHGFWTFLVRCLMLGLGVSLGWVLGVLVAQVLPAGNPAPPLQEQVMRRSSQTWQKLRQLPRWWQGDTLPLAPPGENPAEAPSPPPEQVVTPRLTLDPELQEQVEADLDGLKTDLFALEERLTDLEARLGDAAPGEPVETRLQELDQLINPPAEAGDAAALPPPPDLPAATADVYAEPPFSLVSDTIVLPGALLFEPDSSLLTPAGQQLLTAVVPDLRRYPQASLLVGSHTAARGDNPAANRTLSFQQATAVQGYLAQQLRDTDVHWVTVGYGQTRPRVVGNSPDAIQRNQRVEIGIVPR